MGDEDLVVAVRLCDTNEAEQPDPLCLRPDDLETWRHFEALLRGMYRNPPETISVTYLDDENDWVQVGSDAELLEAVRIAKQAGDILQLQVKKMDTEQLINFENTDSSCTDNTDAGHFVLYIPTTDPGGEGLQPLVYPHPSVDQSSAVDGAKLNPAVAQNEPQWLVYPHHTENIEFPLLHESANHNPCQKLTTSKSLDELEAPKERNNSSIDRGQADDKSFVPLWEEAAGLSTEDKLKFMKNFIGLNSHEANGLQGHKKPEGESNTERRLLKENRKMSIEPLCLEQGSLGKNFIPNQDPFEVDSNVFSKYFEHVMINFEKDKSPTLTPKQAITNKCESNVSYIRTSSIETDGASSVSNVELCPTKQMQDMLVPSPLCQTTQQTRASYTSALPKSKVLKRVPVPMPRNLLMMEGAQSGANAVAIEIPSESADFFQGVSAVNKEEEIAASGGAASTSASEETGEVMARGGSVAAAVSREVKDSSTVVEMYSVPGDGSRSHKSEKKVKRSSSKTKHSSCKKEKALEKKLDSGIDGARPKSSEKSERRSSEHRKKPEETPVKEVKKDEKKIKVTEDVESGEKVNVKKETTALSRSDFAKYMKRTKKELHSAIVKDVARLTETYFSKVVDKTSLESLINDVFGVKDPTYHQGVFCDGCNKEICGIRYKCGNCLDFDLCCFCENKPNLHDSSHVFLKLRYPARRAGIGDDQKYSLLVENIYEAEAIKSLVLENTQEMCGDG
uniref:ZZ-type domain-containing protein n=2 Tax=Arion vulgaris TaxID=1028688 RepID=A0A0B7AMW8_9EUPU